MEHLEVGHLGGVAGLGEGLEGGADHRVDAAAQDHLLTEEVGFRLVPEGRLDHPGPGAPDSIGVRETEGAGVPRGVVMDGEQ